MASLSHQESSTSLLSPLAPQILYGSIGSINTALVVTPLEVVKVLQQVVGVVAGGVRAREGNVVAPSYLTFFRGVKVEPVNLSTKTPLKYLDLTYKANADTS